MTDYISKAEAINTILGDMQDGKSNMEEIFNTALRKAASSIDTIPATDVAPVVHAEWKVTDAYPHRVYCGHCYLTYAQEQWTVWKDGTLPRKCCPNCGAIMDGGTQDA